MLTGIQPIRVPEGSISMVVGFVIKLVYSLKLALVPHRKSDG